MNDRESNSVLYAIWALALDSTEHEFKSKAPALISKFSDGERVSLETRLRYEVDCNEAYANKVQAYEDSICNLVEQLEKLRSKKVYRGPNVFSLEEAAMGNRGIRWISDEGVYGRPTDHDVREHLERSPFLRGCTCEKCVAFYAPVVTGGDAQ